MCVLEKTKGKEKTADRERRKEKLKRETGSDFQFCDDWKVLEAWALRFFVRPRAYVIVCVNFYEPYKSYTPSLRLRPRTIVIKLLWYMANISGDAILLTRYLLRWVSMSNGVNLRTCIRLENTISKSFEGRMRQHHSRPFSPYPKVKIIRSLCATTQGEGCKRILYLL